MDVSNTSQRNVPPELLAPAGGIEQLRYALRFGADAVYLATDRFGLRQRADNFTLDDIPAVAAYVHAQGALLYVACNAFMGMKDIDALPAWLEAIAEAGADALIVSDLGVLRLMRHYVPSMAIHVSTQASCSNAQAALAWHELGAKRIVCAREMSLYDIMAMREALPRDLELEAFVHGAMCMAISGRCLISDFLTDRPANRGHCTQPCRWDYRLEEASRPGQYFPIEESEYGTSIMSSDDLCMLAHIDALKDAGIDALKIEGRNKKAFYVATVVNAYRRVIDGEEASLYMSELETVSHRPYSTGFYFGPASQDTGEDDYVQTYDWVAEVLEASDSGRVVVRCRNRFYEGDSLEVLSPVSTGAVVEVRGLRREYAGEAYEKVDVAAQGMETYSFAADVGLFEHDLLRVKRRDPSRKN